MKIYTKILVMAIMVAMTSPLIAQGNLGQSGVNFLQIGVEPRGTALGGAVTASAAGAAALYWNPAGAVHAQNIDIYLSQTDWFLDTRLMYGAVVKNMGGLGTFGFSVTSFYMDEMEITTVAQSEGTGEFYDAGDICFGLSYARSLTDRFTFGITAKYVREYIWNEDASQLAFDVGSLYQTDFLNMRLGMAIRNFAGKMKFEGDDIDQRIEAELSLNVDSNPRVERLTPEFRLPQTFQMGIAFEPVTMENNRLVVHADVDVPPDNDERLILAAEYEVMNIAVIRGAYKYGYDISDFAFGGGLNLNVVNINARIDYSFSTHDVLDNVHRFGLGFSLN
ncbi:MAG: PorV/PorQ family protein [candidate division KSB1 bacterium]|nr:PorV/PorQ family protein [candidate division KSB1 bacterium]